MGRLEWEGLAQMGNYLAWPGVFGSSQLFVRKLNSDRDTTKNVQDIQVIPTSNSTSGATTQQFYLAIEDAQITALLMRGLNV